MRGLKGSFWSGPVTARRWKSNFGPIWPNRWWRCRESLKPLNGFWTRKINVMRIVGVIPARYASTRFPGKPLHLIAGKPLIQHVVEQCRKTTRLADVIVATDDERIARVAGAFCQVTMTSPDHPSGTDRIAEVA